MEELKYASLYEYLGRRAGKELGGKVFKAAKSQRVKLQVKQVNQGGYKGQVMCYPTAFLAGYFDNNNDYLIY